MANVDPTQRFSSRVDNYIRYRPGYPPEVIDLLKTEFGLMAESVIADIGSGTGALTRLFLENGNRAFGVEPNPKMRQAGENLLAAYPKFTSVAGTAEVTTLPDASVFRHRGASGTLVRPRECPARVCPHSETRRPDGDRVE